MNDINKNNLEKESKSENDWSSIEIWLLGTLLFYVCVLVFQFKLSPESHARIPYSNEPVLEKESPNADKLLGYGSEKSILGTSSTPNL